MYEIAAFDHKLLKNDEKKGTFKLVIPIRRGLNDIERNSFFINISINIKFRIMNKKFSTLVASVLLAGAVGTVNAEAYDSYVKSNPALGTTEAIVDGRAYQISDAAKKKVLVMEEQDGGKMILKMVAVEDADLMSSLWTIRTEDDKEGGVSFVFTNKATGLPLAYSKNGVKVGGTTDLAMGEVSLWKWKSGVGVTSAEKLVSYFDKDSAMVLDVNTDGVVSAKKVFTKNSAPTSSLSVNAYVAGEVVLGADALNSMLGVQPTDGKMKLGFTRDQLKGAENLWLKEYTATTAKGVDAIAQAEAQAAQKAIDAAKAVNTKQGVVNAVLATVTEAYTAEQVKAVEAIAEAAGKADDVAKAKTAVGTEAAKYTAAKASATNKKAYAELVKAAADAYVVADYTSFASAIDGQNQSGAEAAVKDDFKALTSADAFDLAAAKEGTADVVAKYTAAKEELSKLAAAETEIGTGIDGIAASVAAYTDFIDAINALTALTSDADAFATVKELAASVTEDECNGGSGSFELATAQTAAKGKIADENYTTKATTAGNNETLAKAIAGAINDLTGGSKEEYAAVIKAVGVGGSSANADEMEEVQNAMIALVGDKFVKPSVTATQGVVNGYATEIAVATEVEVAANAANAAGNANYATDATAIKAAMNATKKDYISEQNDVVDELVALVTSTDLTDAEAAAKEYTEAAVNEDFVSLISKDNTDPKKVEYLRVDTAYLTTTASDKYQLAFNTGVYNAALKNSKKEAVSAYLQNDFNGRYNFKFTYFPTQDSLKIEPMSAIYPFTDKAYVDITDADFTDGEVKEDKAPQVKLAILAKDHREVTIGDADVANTTTKDETINTRIYLGGESNYVRTTLESGVYFFQLKTADAKRKEFNDKYRVVDYCGDNWKAYETEETTQRFGVAQDFNHMPRTQWVVEQNEGVDGIQTVTIINREFGARYNNVQLYKAGDNVFAQIGAFGNYSVIDTLAYTKVDSKYTTDKYLGYKKFEKALDYEKFYNLDYLSGMELGNFVNFNGDSAVYVDLKGNKTFIEFVPASEDTKFGYASKKANAVQLYKAAYKLRVHNETLLTTGEYYVTISKDGKSYVVTSATSGITPSYFVLKENNQLISEEGDTTCYYALQDVYIYEENEKYYVGNDQNRVGVRDASMAFTVEASCYYSPEKRVATFAVVDDKTPLYRRLGVSKADDGFEDMTTPTAKIYTVNSAAKEYLYEDATSKYSAGKGINFLGLEGKGINAKSAMFVDTAYVRGNTNMPQYMFVMNPQIVKADTIWCNATSTHKHATLADSLACPHTTIIPASITGRYLINAQDSVNAGNKNYIWNRDYTRLAFVDAKHIGDTLVIFRNGKPSTAKADSIFLGNNNHNKDNSKNPVFALRLVNTDACDFLIETVGDHKIPSEGKGGWVAVKNGVPVVARIATYNDAIRDAEIFNIESTDEFATSTDAIEAGEVSVIATEGAVIVKGAAGKNVVITNVLGQTIANTMVNSSEATISAPAGVVVVAIEGEAAVKAIVK